MRTIDADELKSKLEEHFQYISDKCNLRSQLVVKIQALEDFKKIIDNTPTVYGEPDEIVEIPFGSPRKVLKGEKVPLPLAIQKRLRIKAGDSISYSMIEDGVIIRKYDPNSRNRRCAFYRKYIDGTSACLKTIYLSECKCEGFKNRCDLYQAE